MWTISGCIICLLLHNKSSKPERLKTASLIEQVWWFLWVRKSGVVRLGSSGSGSPEVAVRCQPGLQSPEGLSDSGRYISEAAPSHDWTGGAGCWQEPHFLSIWASPQDYS